MLLEIRLSEQSLHAHSPSREETIEQRPSYLTYDYEMELLYENDLEFCAQIIPSPEANYNLTLLLTTTKITLGIILVDK